MKSFIKIFGIVLSLSLVTVISHAQYGFSHVEKSKFSYHFDGILPTVQTDFIPVEPKAMHVVRNDRKPNNVSYQLVRKSNLGLINARQNL